MPEHLNEEQFFDLVKKRLDETQGVEIDEESEEIKGYLADIVFAVLDTYGEHGPVMFGD